MSSAAPWGVIMLCHGSQRGTSPEECSCSWMASESGAPGWCRHCPSTPQGLGETTQRLQAVLTSPRARVLMSCLEFIEPHPDQAVNILAREGIQRMVLLPFLLGHGKHATMELDEVLEGLHHQAPGVQLYLADGLGADPRLADLALERIHNLDGAAPDRPAVGQTNGVLLVKAGTRTQYDDCQWLVELGQMVEQRLGRGYAVDVAQSHYGDPTMEAAAARLVEERGVNSVICMPYLLFPGLILRRNVLGGMRQLQQKYPDIPMYVAPPLGVDDRLVAVAADRIREVWDRVEAAAV